MENDNDEVMDGGMENDDDEMTDECCINYITQITSRKLTISMRLVRLVHLPHLD
jgi:hypothetical protein